MLCTCPPASQSAAPAPCSPGIKSPSSPHPWSSRSPPQTHQFSLRTESCSSTAFAQSGPCGHPPPPPSAPSAGASATQLLDAQKSTPNAAAFAVTHRTQPKHTHASNASQSHPSRRGSTASARTPPPNASIAALTTLPTLPLVRSV